MPTNENSQNKIKIAVQTELDLHVVASKEIDGVEMGVLNEGTPFLTGRGLANLCGIAPSTMNEWGELAPKEGDRLRAGKMAELLSAQGFMGDRLFIKVPFGDQPEVNAYPDSVCMGFLEYYAFEAGRYCTQEAKDNYRILARQKLREFIYEKTGYNHNPNDKFVGSWKHFHDRLLLNPCPKGFFSVFKETADAVLISINAGLIVNEHTVPDISVGKAWSAFWKNNVLGDSYGQRMQWPHAYPEYFPQSLANDQINAFIYPLEGLGAFRIWLQNEYLPVKYPNYLQRKLKKGLISANSIIPLMNALDSLQLQAPHHQG
jgi:hypothetical protein